MPACDHCGKIAQKLQSNANGRTSLKLCPLCQAEFDLRWGGPIRPPEPSPGPKETVKRWWRKLFG